MRLSPESLRTTIKSRPLRWGNQAARGFLGRPFPPSSVKFLLLLLLPHFTSFYGYTGFSVVMAKTDTTAYPF